MCVRYSNSTIIYLRCVGNEFFSLHLNALHRDIERNANNGNTPTDLCNIPFVRMILIGEGDDKTY